MIVEMFNIYYFLFIILGTAGIVGLYYLLRNKSPKTQKIVLASILFFNLALHFTKPLYAPYCDNPNSCMENLWFINLCGASVLFFPFIYLSKSQTAKDYMFYFGVISGAISFLYPTEALGNNIWTMDLWRFYICHWIIVAIPLLMFVLKHHTISYKRIWKMPLCICAVMLFIMISQVLQSELGIISLRGDDITDTHYSNPSLLWGPTDDVGVFFSWLTPEFMKYIPYGEFAGTPKYWPFFWIVPSAIVYGLIIPFIFCLIFDRQNLSSDFRRFIAKFKKQPNEASVSDQHSTTKTS